MEPQNAGLPIMATWANDHDCSLRSQIYLSRKSSPFLPNIRTSIQKSITTEQPEMGPVRRYANRPKLRLSDVDDRVLLEATHQVGIRASEIFRHG